MDKLLTKEEVAVLLGVKGSTIYQWTHQRYIPHVKIGKLVRFRSLDIEKWLKRKSLSGRSAQRINARELGF